MGGSADGRGGAPRVKKVLVRPRHGHRIDVDSKHWRRRKGYRQRNVDVHRLPNLAKVIGADIPGDVGLNLRPPEPFADVRPGRVDAPMTNVIVILNEDLWSRVRFDEKAGGVLLARTPKTVMLVEPECFRVLHQPLPLAVGDVGRP